MGWFDFLSFRKQKSGATTVDRQRELERLDGEPKPLVEYSKDAPRARGPGWMGEHVDPIVGDAFEPRPHDVIWRFVTAENVSAYQLWFQRMVVAGELQKLSTSRSLQEPEKKVMLDLACKAREEHGLHVIVLLVLVHQYINADFVLRSMHTLEWVAEMVKRVGYAPPPEQVARAVMQLHGIQK